MTSDAAALFSAEAPVRARNARARDALEFLLVGGGSLLVLPLLFGVQSAVGFDEAELAVGFLTFHAAMVINNPHFAVTYLLFYRNVKARAFGAAFDRAQRARYWAAGVVAPLALSVWVALGTVDHSARTLGFLIQLMFVLVGWHYVKQGFGVVTVLSARRGVRFDALERRAILLHCFAGWLHGRTNPRDPGKASVVDDVLYTSLPHPVGLDWATRVAFALSALWLVYVLVKKHRREGSLPFVPLAGLVITVWLWVAFSRLDPLFAYVIPALHSLQYLYFVGLQQRNAALAESGPPAFRSVGRASFVLAASAVALGWLLFRGLPALLDSHLVLWDAIDPLGTTPYLAGLTAFVNIHHYLMDAVIWRREVPETRHLFATQ